ncbi:hypothetical protein B0A48_09561 [Cryoendolithus antarcticus]|uniref:Uncharacterized protein n=1 Tax=Cryoendolithus antarcticus TaxID=1507870 RepID=A0A1V8SZZ7_9PEZI|nr:hypothetical protein B0A48_09561 [Cryoendolithus antarcticus]
MNRLEVLVPDNIIEDLHKLASHLPRERAWVIQYLITSRKATALAVNHLKSLRAGTSNTSEQQTDAISSVTAEQQATSEYLDQNILDKDMQISEFFAKSMKSLKHDISASGVGSNENLTASPRTPERIISKGGAKAPRASAQSGKICKISLKRCIKASAITCATSGFASIIIMKGLFKLTVHTATAIVLILRIAIIERPPAIREFMHDVIE